MVKPNKEDQDANRNTSSDPPPQQTEEYLSALEAARILCGEIEVDNMKSDACPCGETSTNESSSGSQGHASMPVTDKKPAPLGPSTSGSILILPIQDDPSSKEAQSSSRQPSSSRRATSTTSSSYCGISIAERTLYCTGTRKTIQIKN